MRFRNISPFVCVLIVLSLVVSACATMTVPPPSTAPAESQPASESAAYPQTHIDAFGREVTIATKPKAIVSLTPSVTEMLFVIGAGPQVVGRTDFDNYPPEVESLPSIGGITTKTMSFEMILDLEPDLVVAGSTSQAEVVTMLGEVGITTFTLAPDSFADIKAGILTMGDITGNVAGAQAVVADMEMRAAALAEKIDTIPMRERVTVFYEVWHEPLMTTTDASFIGELLTLAGGVNIFADLEEAWPTVSAEQIIESDPQAIIGPSMHIDQLTAEVIGARPGWESLTAVQNNAIYIVDGDIISRPGPRVIDALEELAAKLYPDLFQN
jgi:iron complex transport system substrate-binding protein